MTIGEVIKKYRHELGYTQEEMANRLGVTTPAVNKWEHNNTQPDIGLLAPIARLLGITTDTLLSFKDDLTDEEIHIFVKMLDKKSVNTPYGELFEEVKEKVREYPNSEKLKWNVATMLDAWRIAYQVPDSEQYDTQICEWYSDAIDSEDPYIRKNAIESLFLIYYRKEDYPKAESYLSYLPEDDPGRKSRQADIYNKTGRKEEAYRAYEELMFDSLNHLRMYTNALQTMYLEDDNTDMSRRFVNIQSGLAKLFEMGAYHGEGMGLDLAVHEKDVAATEKIMRCLIDHSDNITDFVHSPLYSHMTLKPSESAFMSKLRSDLVESFKDETTYGYMHGNEYWEGLRHYTL